MNVPLEPVLSRHHMPGSWQLAGAEGFEPPSSVLETDSLTVELTPLIFEGFAVPLLPPSCLLAHARRLLPIHPNIRGLRGATAPALLSARACPALAPQFTPIFEGFAVPLLSPSCLLARARRSLPIHPNIRGLRG